MPPVPVDPLLAERVRDALRTVVDPEAGMNIVELGLVYRLELVEGTAQIDLTLTSPTCPMGDMIVGDVHAALAKALPATMVPDIRLVWEPPWNPAMMDEATKQHFGWEP